MDQPAQKDALLAALLPDVPFDGWTMEAMRTAAARIGIEEAALAVLFPNGVRDVVAWFSHWADRLTLETVAAQPIAGMKLGDGLNYNKAFPGNQIAMPQPLHDQQVTYGDGTPATVEQEAKDVVTFLSYISNPEMETRKRMGVKIVLFFLALTGLTYAVKRKVWSDVDH